MAVAVVVRRRRLVGAQPHAQAGKVVLAVIHSAEVASSMGVNVSRVYIVAFCSASSSPRSAARFTAPMISVQPGVSVGVVIVSFAVVIIGGLGSDRGRGGRRADRRPRALASRCTSAPVAELFRIYVAMAIVLMFRPEGLFQRIQARRI